MKGRVKINLHGTFEANLNVIVVIKSKVLLKKNKTTKLKMLEFNSNFIKTLLDKLSRGNKKSIQLNAQPGKSITRLDISDLDNFVPNFSSSFLEKLTQDPNFILDITIDEKLHGQKNDLSKTIKRLTSISRQNTDYFLENGVETFGFGYPILIKRDKKDPKSIIKAPIFIWSLKIEESRSKANTWHIKRQEDFQIRINEVLLSYLENTENIKVEKLHEDYLDDSILDYNEIGILLDDISNSLNTKLDFQSNQKITSFSEFEKFSENIGDEFLVLNSGIFGLFLMQKESIINDLKRISNGDFRLKEPELFNFSKSNSFSVVETDPSQQELINELPFNQSFIIHGPPGTVKSQTLTAVISNFLSNGIKCVVVCEKRTALEVIYENLKREGLEELAALIEDPSKDRRKIIDKARNTIDTVFSREENNIYQHEYHEFEHELLVNGIIKSSELYDEIFSKLNLQIL